MGADTWTPVRIVSIGVLFALLFAGTLGALALLGWPSNGRMQEELFKSALQVLVVGVVGTFLAVGGQTILKAREEAARQQEKAAEALVREQDRLAAQRAKEQELAAAGLSREQDRAAAARAKEQELAAVALAREQAQAAVERDLRRQLLGRVLREYATAKKIRRRLRTKKPVDELFDALNDVQLAFETHKKEVRAVPLFDNRNMIADDFDLMENYLNDVISDCEKGIRAGISFPFSGYPNLEDFVGRYKGSRFQTRFVHAFDRILIAMQSGLVGSASTPAKQPS